MKLATFTQGGATRIGVVEGDQIADLSGVPGIPTDMVKLLESGPSGLEAVRNALTAAKR